MSDVEARQPVTITDTAQEVLRLLAERLRLSADAVRATALAPLPDCSLRQGILLNPRLSARIDARVCGEEGWVLPSYLDDFPQAPLLIELLRDGPERTFTAIGYAWHANTIARLALSDGKSVADRLSRDALKAVLLLRKNARADDDAALLDEAAVTRDGELCVWAWVSGLPERIRVLCMAALLRDTFAHHALKALPEAEKTHRATLADAWLRTSLAKTSGVP